MTCHVRTHEQAGKPTWVERNKEAGKLSVAASVGMINQWDTLEGFNNVDIFLCVFPINIIAIAVFGIMHFFASSLHLKWTLECVFCNPSCRYSDDINVKAGAVLGLGVCTSSVYVLALLLIKLLTTIFAHHTPRRVTRTKTQAHLHASRTGAADLCQTEIRPLK